MITMIASTFLKFHVLGRNPSHTRKIIDDLTEKKNPIYIQSIGQSTLNPDGSKKFYNVNHPSSSYGICT